MMNTKQAELRNLPPGFTIKLDLNGKYANDPVFKKKAEKMKEILEKHPIPEHFLQNKK